MTIGVTLLLGLNALVAIVWGSDPRRFPSPFGDWVLQFGGLRLTAQQIGGALLVAARDGDHGRRLHPHQRGPAAASGRAEPAIGRAARHCAPASGSPPDGPPHARWALWPGVVAAPTLGLSPGMMTIPLLMALAATNLGGITSRVGVVIGGLLIGVLTAIGGRYVPGLGGDLNVVLAFSVVLAVVLVKPAGLFGRESVVRA